MSRFTGGWVKMWRKLLDPEWINCFDGYSKAILLELVLMANLREGQVIYRNSKRIQILRGQVMTSDSELSKALGFSRKIIRQRLKILEMTETISMKRDSSGSVITICNYDKYQMNDLREGLLGHGWEPPQGQVRDTPGTGEGIHNEEENNNKKKKKEKKNLILPVDATASPGGQVWLSYSKAFESRWGQIPSRNKQTNSLCKAFAEKIPIENAPAVAAFYVGHNDRMYVNSMHTLVLMVRDALKLEVEWKNGRTMTSTRAMETEVADYNLASVRETLSKFNR